ncbi:hypothetical protein Tco_1430176 [Tanacetum coccineum]
MRRAENEEISRKMIERGVEKRREIENRRVEKSRERELSLEGDFNGCRDSKRFVSFGVKRKWVNEESERADKRSRVS